MKKTVLCLIALLFALHFAPAAAGAGEMTETEIQQLIAQFDIDLNALESLRDPFMDYRDLSSLTVTYPLEERMDLEAGDAKDPAAEEKQPEGEGNPAAPDFELQGLVSRGDRILAVVKSESGTELVHLGDEYLGYRFTVARGRQAVFEYEGKSFVLDVGGRQDG